MINNSTEKIENSIRLNHMFVKLAKRMVLHIGNVSESQDQTRTRIGGKVRDPIH